MYSRLVAPGVQMKLAIANDDPLIVVEHGTWLPVASFDFGDLPYAQRVARAAEYVKIHNAMDVTKRALDLNHREWKDKHPKGYMHMQAYKLSLQAHEALK